MSQHLDELQAQLERLKHKLAKDTLSGSAEEQELLDQIQELESKIEQQAEHGREITAQRDYFEQIVGNAKIFTGPVYFSKDVGEPIKPPLSKIYSYVPPLPYIFIGRKSDLEMFKNQIGLVADSQSHQIRRISAISGWPGVGKTTFASAFAYDADVMKVFSDGILWTSLDQSPNLLSIFTQWGRWLNDKSLQQATTLVEAIQILASILCDKRMLLIVDDVWNTEHAAPFQQVLGKHSTVVYTTRLPKIAQFLVPTPQSSYLLPVLSEDDAFQLLAALAPEVVKKYPEQSRELVQDLGCLPLALHVAGRLLQAESYMNWGVLELLEELREGKRILEEQAPPSFMDLTKETLPTVAVLLKKSTDCLDPIIRDRFAELGVLAPKPATFDLAALKTIWMIDDPKGTITELVNRGLLEPLQSGRFQMHALLVSHAKALLKE